MKRSRCVSLSYKKKETSARVSSSFRLNAVFYATDFIKYVEQYY